MQRPDPRKHVHQGRNQHLYVFFNPILGGRPPPPPPPRPQIVGLIHKVLTYMEHHSVCPLVGIVTPPTPLPKASVPFPPPPPRTKEWGGGGYTRLRLRGWGSPNSDDWRKSLTLLLLLPTLWSDRTKLICRAKPILKTSRGLIAPRAS